MNTFKRSIFANFFVLTAVLLLFNSELKSQTTFSQNAVTEVVLERVMDYSLESEKNIRNYLMKSDPLLSKSSYSKSPKKSEKKIFILDLGGNISPYGSIQAEDTLKYSHKVRAYGGNANASLLFLRNDGSPIFFGLDWNFQYDRYRSNMNLDHFDQKTIFDLYSYSAGVNFGIESQTSSTTIDAEIVLKGGVIFNSFVDQQVASSNSQIITASPYGQYGELQLNLVGYRGSGIFFSIKCSWNEKFESNFNSFYAINGYDFNLEDRRTTLKLGVRLGIF